MVKDSNKYPMTSGWGFADFTNGNLVTRHYTKRATSATCLPKIVILSLRATRRRPELKQALGLA
jgi:hypothetical protein